MSPRRIFGVDFSGANDAGRHTWICRAHPGRDGIRVESVDPLMDLPGGARGRQEALRSLVPKVLEAPRSAWGSDCPFALPMDLLEALGGRELGGWDDQVRIVAARRGYKDYDHGEIHGNPRYATEGCVYL